MRESTVWAVLVLVALVLGWPWWAVLIASTIGVFALAGESRRG